MADCIIGVDVGGTKILAAVVDAAEQVVARAKVETPASSSDELMTAVEGAIREVVAKAGVAWSDVRAIGLGVPGVVGPDGTCIWAPNCPLSGVPVAQRIHETFGVPTAVGNDVNVGTLGEKTYGAAREFQNVFGMFVGTGIGGGLVINGQVVIGDHCVGAEVGHILIDCQAAARGDEGGGEFEYYASRLGIERQIRAAIAAGRPTVIAAQLDGDDDRIKSGALKRALAAGDEVVTEVLTNVGVLLGLGTVTVIHICDPEAIIFGGGVIEACGDFLLPLVEATVKQHVAPGNGQPIRIIPSALGDDAVLLGAAALAQTAGGLAPAPASAPTRTGIDASTFGQVSIDGVRLAHDVVIRVDGLIKKRKKSLSREVTGSAHKISAEELESVCKGDPQTLIIGGGHETQLELTPAAEEWLQRRGIACQVVPTPQAPAVFAVATGAKALLLHVSC